MKTSLLIAALVTSALAFPRAARADQEECPTSHIGQACAQAGATCIDATCCDDPGGCAFDAGTGTGSGGSSSSSGGAGAGTGVARACAVCEFLGAPYCSPADLGKACPGDAGICGESGGGGGPALELDGGTTSVGFAFSVCGAPDESGDGGTGFGSSGGASSSGGSSSGGSGASGGSSSGGGSSSSGSSSSGSSGGTGSSGAGSSGGTASDAGTDPGTVTSGCGVAPVAPRESPWGVGACLALGAAVIARRVRRRAR